MLNMIESRVMEHTWRALGAEHRLRAAPGAAQSVPDLAAAVRRADRPHAPPIPSGQINMIGMAIAQGLAEHNQPGAVHMLDTYDAWYPGLHRLQPDLQEHPVVLDGDGRARRAIPGNVNADRACSAQPKALYTDPFPGGEWHLRNAVEYDETASLSVLEYAAKYKESLLYGRYQSGMRSDREGPQRRRRTRT